MDFENQSENGKLKLINGLEFPNHKVKKQDFAKRRRKVFYGESDELGSW
jgi:hypothetical protein